MYPYQHGDEENRFQQGEGGSGSPDDPEAVFNKVLYESLENYLRGDRNSEPIQDHNDGEQPSGDRHSRPLQDHNDGEQPSGDRHSRPLQDHNDGEQPSGDRHSRPLQDHNDGEQPSGDRHSRPLEDPNGGEQPSGDKPPASEARSDPIARNGQNKLASGPGITKGKDETLMYLHDGNWVPAVYHDTVRHYLIEEAKKNGEYDFPREAGIEPDNVTSFLESQKSWGPVRDENWAEILYVFEKKEKNPPQACRVNLQVGGRVVLAGSDSRPILDYKDIPATLSTELVGRDMEAIKRTDPRVGQRDFIARMPMKYTTRTGKRRKVKSSSWIGMEMTRFRQKHGLLSWTDREGSDVIRNGLWERLPQKNKENNSIRGLPPPSLLEQEEVREGNLGKFTKNAGVRALPNDERAKRQLRKEQRRLEKLADREGPATGFSRSKTTATTSGVDGMAGRDGGRRGQHARDSRPQQDRNANERGRRPSPDFPDNMMRQDRDQEEDESDDGSDTAPPKDGTRQRIDPRLRHRPRGRPQKTRERFSASDDRCMQPPENFAHGVLPAPLLATVNQFEPLSPPDYEAYVKRQAFRKEAAQQSYR